VDECKPLGGGGGNEEDVAFRAGLSVMSSRTLRPLLAAAAAGFTGVGFTGAGAGRPEADAEGGDVLVDIPAFCAYHRDARERVAASGSSALLAPVRGVWRRWVCWRQELNLVHYSAQPEPFCHANKP
jgi:hypothetical protein